MTPEDTARHIIATNNYLTLATADRDGHPWVSPVCYTPDNGTDFYWVSRPDTRHSTNLAERPEVAIVIFNSQVALFSAEAVYLTAYAEQVAVPDLETCARIYRSRHPELASFELGELSLYRARAVEASVLLNDDGPDLRIPLPLPL